jgi:hypothetical protein
MIRSDWFGLNGGYGLDIRSVLHRFDSIAQLATIDMGSRVAQAVGESAGTFHCRWLLSPDDFAGSGQYPPTLFDPWHHQSFVMLDCDFTFGSGKDVFRGYGLAAPFP